jgi:lipoprotein signal peptidase
VGLVVLSRLYRQTADGDRWRVFAISLVTAGAIGNLVDRIISASGVVDFTTWDRHGLAHLQRPTWR